MTRIASSLNHRDRHASLFHPIEREFDQSAADAATLKGWIDRDHVDFAHAIFGVKLHGDKPYRQTCLDRNPYIRVVGNADFLDRLLLTDA